jgi:hypothetical protein
MTDLDLQRLRERLLSRLSEKWPERDIDMSVIEQDLELGIETDAEGPAVSISLLGYAIWSGFDGSADAASACVDDIADNLADNLEGDRWMTSAWQEYRPDDR